MVLPNENSFWMRHGGGELVLSVKDPGVKPFPNTLVVIKHAIEWPDETIEVTMDYFRSMMPQGTVILAPAMLHPGPAPRPETPRDRIDFITTDFLGKPWHTVDGCYMAEIDTTFVSLSCSTPPPEIALHEIWHNAEQLFLSPQELDDVAGSFVQALHITGFLGSGRAVADAEIARHSVSEWAAMLFVSWYRVQTTLGLIETDKLLDGLFHSVCRGDIGSRKPRKPLTDMAAVYAPLVEGYLKAALNPEPDPAP